MNARRLIVWCIAALLGGGAISQSGSGTDRPPGTVQLHGAGATFPAPLYKKWLEEYRKHQPMVEVSYDPIGSGTTYAFTNHLSAISEEWRDRGPGVGRNLQWPGNAMAARGNEGVAGRIKLSKGAIGYVEYGIARRAGLAMAWLENKEGQMIRPHGGSGLATLLSMDMPASFRAFEPDPEGSDGGEGNKPWLAR